MKSINHCIALLLLGSGPKTSWSADAATATPSGPHELDRPEHLSHDVAVVQSAPRLDAEHRGGVADTGGAGGSLRGGANAPIPRRAPRGRNLNLFETSSTEFVLVNGDLYEVEVSGDDGEGDATTAAAGASTAEAGSSGDGAGLGLGRQKAVWDLISTFDSYKTSGIYAPANGRPTLKAVKYMMLPIWWDGENTTDPANLIDSAHIDSIMGEVRQHYLDMSWGKVDLTWQTLGQQVLTGVTPTNADFGNSADAARAIVSQTYVEGVDYDAISLVYNLAEVGPFSGGGGWASVNGNFMWNSDPIGFGVTRHEVGHNFGHPHHKKHSYEYRNTGRPTMKENWDGLDYSYDGFDMMSGGNGYPVSHFAAASKWFWNWIEDSCIIRMQPEGPTAECPDCERSGTYQLALFDGKDLPPNQDRKMAIHIPLAAQGNRLYSFWLSYRSSLPGVPTGLSVHFTEFSLGGMYGATYDSHRYFAFGDSGTDKNPAFVLPNTCFYLYPSMYLKDRDYLASEDVHPVACVDDIIEDVSINVTVNFIEPENPPPQSALVNPISIVVNCSDLDAADYVLDANEFYSFEIQGTGANGDVTVSTCVENSSSDVKSSVYLHDQYPYSAASFDSPASYGAFKSLDVSALECCDLGTTISVQGAKVVRIKQNREEFLHLNEIQVFDENGNNVALDGNCYSYDIGYGGDPNCLNDGITGTYPDTCNSHSSWYNVENYDYCVLSDAVNVTSVTIYPWNDPTRTWMTGRLNDLTLSLFADVSGQSGAATFIGELYSERLLDEFTSSQTGPRSFDVTLLDTIDCPNTNPTPSKSLVYRSDYDSTHVVIPSSSGALSATSQTSLTLSCAVNSCMQNSYKDLATGSCVACPPDSRSPAGSTDISQCAPCPDSMHLAHKWSASCSVSMDQTEFQESTGWRIWATDYHTIQNWLWDVRELEFYSSTSCNSEDKIPTTGVAIDSGNAGGGWGPANAFDGSTSVWGGRKDSDNLFWVGMTFASPVSVKCVRVWNSGATGSASEIRIQAFDSNTSRWENAWIETDFDTTSDAWNTIPLIYYTEGPTASSSPTTSPTMEPTAPPTPDPTFAPTPNPTPAPTAEPTLEPTQSPTDAPTTEAPSVSTDPTVLPTPEPTPAPTFPPSNAPTSEPSPAPTLEPTAAPTPAPTNAPVDSVDKYICKKTRPSDAEICATDNLLGDTTCPTANESCGNGGKICQVASCPGTGGPPPTPPSPTPPPPTPPTDGCSSANCGACSGGGECNGAGCNWSKGSCS